MANECTTANTIRFLKPLEDKTMSTNEEKTKKSYFVSSYEHEGFETFDKAKEEAQKRASRDRDGDTYFVYELVGTANTPPRIYNTNWEDVR